MENGNGEGKGEFINQNNDFFLDSMSMLSSLPPCWDPSLPPPPPPPNSLFHALAVDATFPDQFHHPQESGGPTMGSQEGLQAQGTVSTTSAPVVRQKPRVRARRGQATDPHSIAERLRRERIAERMKSLQELVPNTNKTDKASMLDEIIEYVRFLQLQVKVLSMSRLGGAGAAGPRLNGLSAEVSFLVPYGFLHLQGKGLCLMPISLATAISSSTTHSRGSLFNPISNPVAAEDANVVAAVAAPEASSTMDDVSAASNSKADKTGTRIRVWVVGPERDMRPTTFPNRCVNVLYCYVTNVVSLFAQSWNQYNIQVKDSLITIDSPNS